MVASVKAGREAAYKVPGGGLSCGTTGLCRAEQSLQARLLIVCRGAPSRHRGASAVQDLLKKRKITGLCIKSKRFIVGGRDCRLIVYPRGEASIMFSAWDPASIVYSVQDLLSSMDPCLLLPTPCSSEMRRASLSNQDAQGLPAGVYLLLDMSTLAASVRGTLQQCSASIMPYIQAHTSLLLTVWNLCTEQAEEDEVCLRSTHHLYCYRAVKPSQPPFHVPGGL